MAYFYLHAQFPEFLGLNLQLGSPLLRNLSIRLDPRPPKPRMHVQLCAPPQGTYCSQIHILLYQMNALDPPLIVSSERSSYVAIYMDRKYANPKLDVIITLVVNRAPLTTNHIIVSRRGIQPRDPCRRAVVRPMAGRVDRVLIRSSNSGFRYRLELHPYNTCTQRIYSLHWSQVMEIDLGNQISTQSFLYRLWKRHRVRCSQVVVFRTSSTRLIEYSFPPLLVGRMPYSQSYRNGSIIDRIKIP